MGACTREKEWYWFITVPLVTYLGGLAILIPSRILWYLYHKGNKYGESDDKLSKKSSLRSFRRIRAAAVGMVSGHNAASKTLVGTLFLLNLLSIVLYLIEATKFEVEICESVSDDPIQLLYIVLCGIFLIHFVIRFMGSSDKLWFWLEVYTIVDHFTIGPTFYGLYVGRNWIGLRFLRLLYLLQVPEILQMLNVLRAASHIRLAQIGSIFFAVWMTSTGFAHLIENNGDPHKDWANAQHLGYWEGMYWLLVTMSTVGYGEITPSTDIGRAFIILYIMGTFAMFATMVPELLTHLATRTKYSKPYKRIYGKRHIVVCGHITYESVSLFIKNFIHEDADNRDINVVLVDKNKPDLELEAFLKRNMNDVVFLQGSIMDLQALRDCKLRDAQACLILANRMCSDPDEEDAANIMRATSVKNYYGGIRVIIQLHQFHNKTYLLHIPNWNWDKLNGDDCICLAELKLGLMAQNCMAPGVATLMANLFTNRSYSRGSPGTWQDIYNYGASNEIYCYKFSAYFIGMTFNQAAEVCYTELNLLLFAIETGKSQTKEKLRLNPQSGTIGAETIGFFIAQSPEEVRRVTSFQTNVKKNAFVAVKNGNLNSFSGDPVDETKRKNLKHRGEDINDNRDPEQDYLEYLEGIGTRKINDYVLYSHQRRPSMAAEMIMKNKMSGLRKTDADMFDFTGMFHWCPGVSMEECSVDQQTVRNHHFRNHVVLCLLSDENSPLMGLVNFVMPLRTSNVRFSDLKDIVILCDTNYLKKEWSSICTFPKIYVFHGSASHRPDLRALNVEQSRMSVILSAKKHIMVDKTLLDKEAILAALHLQGMFGDTVERRIKALGTLTNVEDFRNQMGGMNGIPLTTELEIDSNVAFLDQDDDDDPEIPLYMTQPFACGSAFAASCLDSLMSATFHNRQVMIAVRALITGGEIGEFEKILAEGLGIVRKQDVGRAAAERERSHLALLHVNEEPLVNAKAGMMYGSLFVGALKAHGILCLGLYRTMETKVQKRYVITNPARDFLLLPSDQVFCLIPNNAEHPNEAEEKGKKPDPGFRNLQHTIEEEPAQEAEPFVPLRRVGKPKDTKHDTTKM